MLEVSTDLGSSVTKGGCGDRIAHFPSLVLRHNGPRHQGICVDGAWYLVGEDAMAAQNQPSTNPQSGSAYHGSLEQRVLLCEALRRLEVTGEQEVALALGLPYDLSMDDPARDRVRSMCQSLAWATPDDKTHCIKPRRVFMPPQGGGALFEYMTQHGGSEGMLVGVVDIGGQTADATCTRLGSRVGAETPMPAASRSLPVNVEVFFDMLVQSIRNTAYAVPRHYNYYDLMARVRHQRYLVSAGPGKPVQDIAPNVHATRNAWTQVLLGAVKQAIGARWADLDVVILTGGGAALVDLTVWEGPVLTMDDMANVRGQLLAMKGSGT